jgi:hypothetical protein
MDNSSFHTIIKLKIIGVPYHSPFYIFKWSYNFILFYFLMDLNLSPYRSLPFADFSFSMSLMVVGHFWYSSCYHDVPTKYQVPHPIAYWKKLRWHRFLCFDLCLHFSVSRFDSPNSFVVGEILYYQLCLEITFTRWIREWTHMKIHMVHSCPTF